jgi:beta-galactosidase
VNVYMGHGGTSFGTTAGANYEPPTSTAGGRYKPTVTSYDYDAPLDERGAPTPKFHAYRDVIARYRPVPELEEYDAPLLAETRPVPSGAVLPLAAAFNALSASGADVVSPTPLTFEELGLVHGLVRYQALIRGPRAPLPLTIDGLADRAQLYVDGRVVHVYDRNEPTAYLLDVPPEGRLVELVVESMGRVNYGRLVGERKGITGAVLHSRQEVHGWTMTPLCLAELPALNRLATPAPGGDAEAPGFRSFTFDVDAPGDTWVDLSGWGKGYAWVNGFGLGRYWSIGPQLGLFTPAPVVTPGRNTLDLLELDAPGVRPPILRPCPVRVEALSGTATP